MNMQELRQIIYSGEKVDVECKKAESSIPKSVYESYSAFANAKGGYIVLGVDEDKKKTKPEERYLIQGTGNPSRQLEDFWNTINSDKVNINILKDEDVFQVKEGANHEGDYHCTNAEVRVMFRDQNAEGVDDMVIEHYTMDDVDADTLHAYRMRFQNENGEHIWNTYEDKPLLPKLTAELPKPFKLKGYVREDDTPLHKAVREACVNMIIHADYMLEETLKVIKTAEGFEITNPGVLKIPKEQIFQGGNSKARNPRMQSMFRMVGYGDNVGSGFPTILNAWEEQGWEMPDLLEQGKIEATGSTKGKMYRKC